MFNFDSEVWLVVYPHGAGGRLMGLMLSLDPAMAGPDGQHNPPTRHLEYQQTILYGINAHWMSHELNVAGSRCNGHDLLSEMAYRDKYIFTGHMDTVWLDFNFYRRCKELKIIVLSADDGYSFNLLNSRRQILNGGLLTGHEYTITQMSHSACAGGLSIPVANIEIRDYWDPDKFIPKFEEIIKTNKLSIPKEHWENLYLLWHSKLPNNVLEMLKRGY